MLVILVNKKKAVWTALLIIIFLGIIIGYKPYLKRFEYPLKFSEYVLDSADRYNLDPYLIYSVIKAESKFNANAKSLKEAQGLMQITPETADWAKEIMGYPKDADIFSPQVNIDIGSWYLAKLLSDHNGDLTAALAAYNAGSSNVNGWKDERGILDPENIQFEETYDYVNKITEYYKTYQKLYEIGE